MTNKGSEWRSDWTLRTWSDRPRQPPRELTDEDPAAAQTDPNPTANAPENGKENRNDKVADDRDYWEFKRMDGNTHKYYTYGEIKAAYLGGEPVDVALNGRVH